MKLIYTIIKVIILLLFLLLALPSTTCPVRKPIYR